MNLKKAIYEHLKTRRKYNTLEIKYKAKCEEADDKTMLLKIEKRIKEKQIKLFDEKLKEYMNELISIKEEKIQLKRENIKLKKEIKELIKNGE